MSEKWSVLATGTLHRVELPVPLLEAEVPGITPWAGGERETHTECFEAPTVQEHQCQAVVGLRPLSRNASYESERP